MDSVSDWQIRGWVLDHFEPDIAEALLAVRSKYAGNPYHMDFDITDSLMFDSLNCIVDPEWRKVWV